MQSVNLTGNIANLKELNIAQGKARIDSLGNLFTSGNLEVVGLTTFEGHTVFNSAVQFDSDVNITGNTNIKGDLISANASHSILTSGLLEVAVDAKTIDENSRVFLTATGTKCGNDLIVSKKDNDIGFTVALDRPIACDSDVEFDWWIVKSPAQ